MSRAQQTIRSAAVLWWNELFPVRGDSVAARLVRFRVLRKGGQPFLLLPTSPRLAAMGLQLYPGQRALARIVSGTLATLLRCGLPAPIPCATLPLRLDDPLIRFLANLALGGKPNAEIPAFAVLAGNPFTAGRRFVLLVWKLDGQPAGVVKAGCGPDARRLIEEEEKFLRLVPRGTRGIPTVLDTMSSESVRAFALPFVAGRNPPLEPTRAVEELLASWVNTGRTVRATEVETWNTLRRVCAGDMAFEQVAKRIEARDFATLIAHGDFAPWNLRVRAEGECTALDWERGVMPGMPGWDWFHYVIQSALLVRRIEAATLQNRLEELLASARFQAYAQKTQMAGREKLLLLAYLHHVVRVLKPAEGLEANRELQERLAAAWRSESV